MENLWTKINDNVPIYFEEISQEYKLNTVKISDLKTAFLGNKFAIIISIGRFDVDVFYASVIDDKQQILSCGNFLAEKYTDEDRKYLQQESNAETIITNYLIVIANGMKSKWDNLLRGETKWIEDFKKSKWYSHASLSHDESTVLWEMI